METRWMIRRDTNWCLERMNPVYDTRPHGDLLPLVGHTTCNFVKLRKKSRTFLGNSVTLVVVLGAIRNTGDVMEATLTKRQQEVVHFLAEGLLNKEVAAILNISESTVKYHRAKIGKKLGDGIPALVRYAIREGLINP
jgi:DNA-binding NarL/FixJ family response regulator